MEQVKLFGCQLIKYLYIRMPPKTLCKMLKFHQENKSNKGLNGIAGYYNYSFQSGDDKVTCSGRIYVSGRKQNLRFSVGRDCQDLSSGEF